MRNTHSLVRRVARAVTRLIPTALIAAAPGGALAASQVGGHVGLATSLVTRTSESSADTDISDTFTLIAPIGVTVKLTDRFAMDFETQVVNSLKPKGGKTALVVAPGAVYNFGPFAAGLRVASNVSGANPNVGAIPIINRGVAKLGPNATWFVEAAFPTFWHRKPDPKVTFDVVVHTGVAF